MAANPKVTFVTWLWKGWRNVYGAEHVVALRNMLRKHGPEHRLIVVSDDKLEVPNDVLVYPLWEHPLPPVPHFKQNCFVRLKLFDPEFGPRFGDRVVSIDLDTLIQKDISHLFETRPDYRAVRGVSSKYNGGMWELRTGTNRQVWHTLVNTPHIDIVNTILDAKRLGYHANGSDQAWMSIQIPNGEFWDESNGVYHYSENNTADRRGRLADAALICFAGSIKPWDDECKRITPDIHQKYMEHLNA